MSAWLVAVVRKVSLSLIHIWIGYIPQFVKHEAEEISAFDFLAKPFVELQKKSEAICAEMETSEDMDEVYGRYQNVLDEMDAIDAYNYDSNIRKELAIAGMTALEDTSVTKISGGEFKLLSIIRSMLLKPQLLICLLYTSRCV